MFNQDTYHAAMVFCKQLDAELKGQDRAAWIRAELAPKYNPKEKAKPTMPHYDQFLLFKEERDKLKKAA